MPQFMLHLTRRESVLHIESAAASLLELGDELVRRRFVAGTLLSQDAQPFEPAPEVLIPLQSILLLARDV